MVLEQRTVQGERLVLASFAADVDAVFVGLKYGQTMLMARHAGKERTSFRRVGRISTRLRPRCSLGNKPSKREAGEIGNEGGQCFYLEQLF